MDELREENRQLREALKPETFVVYPALNLSRSEAMLLAMLRDARTVLSKERMRIRLDAAWRRDRPGTVKGIDVHICRLRKKLRPFGVEIDSVWGVGLSMTAESKTRLLALARGHDTT